MQTIVVVVHLLVVIALVASVLIQQSEGRDLGVGGSYGGMTTRSTKNALTRLTAIFATCFFLTSVILTVLQAISSKRNSDLLDRLPISNKNQDITPLGNLIEHQSIPLQQDETNTANLDENNSTKRKE